MKIFEYRDYREFMVELLHSMPKRGHGVLTQWAKALRVSIPLMSQILKGIKGMTHEMADDLSRHLGLSEKELDYFLLLVDYDRAGTPTLRTHLKKKITEAQAESRQLKNRIKEVVELSSEARAIYYSSWIYSGIRNLVACEEIKNVEDLSLRLNLPRPVVVQLVEFLMKFGLILETPEGLEYGPQSTYISSNSPLVQKHHQNWRLKGIQRMDVKNEENLFYTSPMSLSLELANKVRKRLVDVIQEVQKEVGPSPSEVVRCLSIDWFDY